MLVDINRLLLIDYKKSNIFISSIQPKNKQHVRLNILNRFY